MFWNSHKTIIEAENTFAIFQDIKLHFHIAFYAVPKATRKTHIIEEEEKMMTKIQKVIRYVEDNSAIRRVLDMNHTTVYDQVTQT